MARPPIVISNGGMASYLTTDLVPKEGDSRNAVEIILENVATMNERGSGSDPPVAKTLSGRNRDNNPRIYWRFEDDTASNKELGIEAQ